MELSGNLNTPAALTSEKKLQYRLKRMKGDGGFKNVEKYFFLFGNQTRFYPVVLPTE
jgi:hypothetical protein